MFRIAGKRSGNRPRYDLDEDLDDSSGGYSDEPLRRQRNLRPPGNKFPKKKATTRSFEPSPSGATLQAANENASAAAAYAEARGAQRVQTSAEANGDEQKSFEQALESGEQLRGRLHWVAQSKLVFGSNAKIPRRERPVMCVLKRLGQGLPVLPATTKAPTRNQWLFYPLATGVVFYTDSQGVTSGRYATTFLFHRYESIRPKDLLREIGWIDNVEELEKIRRWLLGRRAAPKDNVSTDEYQRSAYLTPS